MQIHGRRLARKFTEQLLDCVCATNFPFSFGTVLGGGGRSFSDTKPPGASGPMPIFTPKPVNVSPKRLLDFAASDTSQVSGPHRLGGGGVSELFGP